MFKKYFHFEHKLIYFQIFLLNIITEQSHHTNIGKMQERKVVF